MDEPEKQCRICFDDADDASNPMLRPCRCRGSMAWVHMGCLDHWRTNSANPRSFYRCDQCHFEYRFGTPAGVDRFTVARFLSTRFAVHLLSLAALAAVIFVAGFVAKMFDSSLGWWDVIACFNINHYMVGSIATGAGSLIGWVTTVLPYGGFRMFGDFGFLTRGERDNKAGSLLFGLMVIIGLAIALYWIYGRLERLAQRTTRYAQRVVLDAHTGDYTHVD